jgi:hypothetical protein
VGHYLTIKQIDDEKNNFSIVEKINQLSNLVKCMKKKINIIEKVERRKIQEKNKQDNFENSSLGEQGSKFNKNSISTVILRRLDKANKKFEIVE